MLVEKLDDKMKTLLNVPKEINGVYVIFVDFNSSSYKAGIKMGDVIFQIDNKKLPAQKISNHTKNTNQESTNSFSTAKGGTQLDIFKAPLIFFSQTLAVKLLLKTKIPEL